MGKKFCSNTKTLEASSENYFIKDYFDYYSGFLHKMSWLSMFDKIASNIYVGKSE
jgi:hypothetical protein